MTAQEIALAVEAEREELGMGLFKFKKRSGITRGAFLRAMNGQGVQFYTVWAAAEAVGMEIVVRKKEKEDAQK